MAKKKYTAKERKAYHMGRAYAAAKAGKRVDCPDEKTKQSFRNGVKDARKVKSKAKSASGVCLVVDENGVVVGKMRC